MWDAAPWLAELRQVPEDATWPRLMSGPHPDAVGSYGPEVVAQFERRTGGRLRWWQKLAAYRLLEHDAQGRLIWTTFLLTLARQVGKSWLLRELCLWRMLQDARWGEQLVLHTGKDLAIVREVLRPAQEWAESNGLYASRDNLKPGISTAKSMGGSRWLIKAKDSVYGYSPGMAVVDEAWDVRASTVDDALFPTLVEQPSPQMGLISTAHRKATGLMLDRRTQALRQLLEPDRTLLLEWSSPTDLARDDVAGWRMASPHWTEQRERLIASAWARASTGESDDPDEPDPLAAFDAQWLNRWPARRSVVVELPGEPLVPAESWESMLDDTAQPTGPLWVGVEDNLGEGAAAAAAALTDDGRIVVGGWEFESRAEAFAWARGWTEVAQSVGQPVRVVVGASLAGDLEVQELTVPVDKAGKTETPSALADLRALVHAGVLTHDGGEDLALHVMTARVRRNTESSALALISSGRSDLLRVAAWVVQRADQDRGARVAIH